ncbi:tape measure protein [Comamonas testosteroni]
MSDELVTQLKVTADVSQASQGFTKIGAEAETASNRVSKAARTAQKSLADLGVGTSDNVKKLGEASKQAASGIVATGSAAKSAVSDTNSLNTAVEGLNRQELAFINAQVRKANAMRMNSGDMAAYIAQSRGMSQATQDIARAVGQKMDVMKQEQAAMANSTSLMSQAIKAYGAMAAAIYVVTQAIGKLVGVQREFDKLNSSLITVTGSAANAASQMAWLKDFAKETPFGLAQATEAFVKMKSLGLDPTRQALTSFGNTASAMGKDLNQMIEAVADASTGEFERLKEFGIKASKDGEEIKFTFQGVTTTVRNSAEEITKYLEQIGNNQFAGAMAERAKTLDGAISELGDTWDNLFRTINEQNTGQFIYDSVKLATGAIEDLTTIIGAANQAMNDGAQAGNGFKAVQDAIATVFETVIGLGLNVKYVLTQIGNEIGGLVAQGAALARGDFAGAAAIRDAMVADAQAARAAVDQQTANVLKARENAQAIINYRKQIAASDLGGLAGQVDGYKPIDADSKGLQSRVDSALNSTKGLKSQAEAMSEVVKQGNNLKTLLKELQDAGQGTSQSAKDLEARLAGVNEKIADMAKKGKDRSGEAAVKKEQSEYEKLVNTIKLKILQNEEELKYGRKLSDAEKLRILITEDSSKKLTAAHKVQAQARLKELEDGDRAIEALKEETAARKAWRDERQKAVDAVFSVAQSLESQNEQLRDEIALIGKNKQEQAVILQMRRQQVIATKEAALAALQAKQTFDVFDTQMIEALQEQIKQLKERNELLGLKDVSVQADAVQQKLRQQFDQTVQQVEDIFVSGFADMMNNGKSGWESFCKSLKTSFYTMVAKEIYAMFAKPIVVQLVGSLIGISGGGIGSSAMQIAGGAASGGGIFSNISSGLSGANAFGMLGAFGGGMSAGLGGLLGSLGLTGTGTTFAGALSAGSIAMGSGNILGGLGTFLGAFGPIIGGLSLLFGGDLFGSLFGRKLKESGVEGEFGGDTGFEGRLFKYYKGGLFRSNKTTYEDMPEEMRKGLGDQFLAMDESIRAMAGAVGLGGEALDGFTAKIKVNLKGLSEEEATKKLQEEFQKIADQMGGLVLTTDEYTRAGETQLEALTRLALSITTVNGVFDALGTTLLDASLASADWASSLIEVMGGLDKFSQAAATYYDLYYSDAEKRAQASKVANKGMADMGLDLRTTDADAKKKYRELVDNAVADKDEELLAWLLQFADDFANGVDAVTASIEEATNSAVELMQKQLDEIQRVRDDTLNTLGLSIDGLVDGFIKEVNEGRGAQAGQWLADTIASGFEQAIYGQALTIVMNSIIDGVITPVVTAAMTGSSVSAAVSGAAIDSMVANAQAAADALSALLTDPAFKEAMEQVFGIVRDLGNDIGKSIPVMSTYRPAVQEVTKAYESSTNAADEAAKAAQKLADEWSKLIDSMSNEMDRLRGELLGASANQGASYYESMFAIKTAQARAGDQNAAAELPSLIQKLEEIAKGNASSQSDVLLKQAEWLASLTDTRNYLAGKYGVDISNQKGAEVAATTTGRIIQTTGNTAVLNALQSSSDNPALLAELRALRVALETHGDDRKAEALAITVPIQRLEKRSLKWDVEGMPPTRKETA